jgi:hypothetical protein
VAARFDAFISYSRAASSTLAVELRNGIERFAKPWYRLRSSRVFLDDASMSANTGLWSNIEVGLTEAEWFILLCSPGSAASQYVTTEVTWWLEHKSADRMLLVRDEGEILWDAAAGDFDWSRSTAVNRALSKAFAEEPRWVELSWFEAPESLGTADPRFPERVADLAAAVRGVERDELIGENVRARRRALNLLRGGVIALSVLLVGSLVATVIAVVNGNAAVEQARIAQARQLAAQAIVASSTDLRLASLLAVEAVRLHDDSQTEAALFQLQNTSPYLVRTLDVGSQVHATALSRSGTAVTGDEDGIVSRWTGAEREDLIQLPGAAYGVAVSDDAVVVAAVSFDPPSLAVLAGSTLLQADLSAIPASADNPAAVVGLSHDGRYVAIGDDFTWSAIYEVGGDRLSLIGTTAVGGRFGFSEDAVTVFTPSLGNWQRVSLADGSLLGEGEVGLAQVTGVAVSGDGEVVAGTTDRGINYNGWRVNRSTDTDTPRDLVATSLISGSLDMALDSDGGRFATQAEGAIYVSEMREPSEPPEAPLVLDGSGVVNGETLSFVGDLLISGSGDRALVWDLNSAGRATTQYLTPVPEGCNACNSQLMRLNDAGTALVMTDQSGNSTVVVDLTDGRSRTLSSFITFGDGPQYSGASWFDDHRVIVYSRADAALLVLSGAEYATVDLTIPVTLADPDAIALSIRANGSDGTVTLIDNVGGTQTIDVRSGHLTASSSAFAPVSNGQAAGGIDIAPDQKTAYVWQIGGPALYVDVASGEVIYSGNDIDGMAYDVDSRLHLFDDGAEAVIDAQTGKPGTARPAEVDQLRSVAISPDARLAVEGGSTGQVTLLDLAARGAVLGRIAIPVQDQKQVVSLFTNDGTKLVMSVQEMAASGSPSAVRVIDLTVAGWVASSCAVAGRDLTPEEWGIYVGTTPPDDLRCDR